MKSSIRAATIYLVAGAMLLAGSPAHAQGVWSDIDRRG
jgi:hypothetical protein